MRVADELEPSGASPFEIAVAAHQKCLAEFNAYKDAAVNHLVVRMQHRNLPQRVIENAKRSEYEYLESFRRRGEDSVVKRVIEIRAKAVNIDKNQKIKQADDEFGAAVDVLTALDRLVDAKGIIYVEAILRAAVSLEPSGDSPAEIAEAALVKCQPELAAVRKADADFFSCLRQQSSKDHTSDAWENRMKENEILFVDLGTNAVIKWVTGVRKNPSVPRSAP